MNYLNKKNNIGFPLNLIENLKDIPSNHAFPCSVLVNNAEIGGIFMVCSSQDMEYFNILPTSPPDLILNLEC
ncbi:MAG: hypothetical protein HW421_1088 [Ignavibacteria bacterium]|nr:hypothetical protein [Ignavibacteria bacterium]